MASQSVESEVLRSYTSEIHETIAHPISVALLLYQEGVVSKVVVDEVADSTKKTVMEKNADLIRAVRAAVKADPKMLWMVTAVLEKFAEPAPVARKMKDELHSRGLEAPQQDQDIPPASVSAAEGSSSPGVEMVPVDNHSQQSLSQQGNIVVSEVYKNDFDKIQRQFSQLFHDITKMVEKAPMSLEALKEYLDLYDDLEAPLQHADTISEVMRVVQQHSSFINCSYLEGVADHFESEIPEAKKKIKAYNDFVEQFCQHKLSQHSYAASLLADPTKHLLSSETITFKLQWDPVQKTLSHIQGILRKTFHKLASRIHVKDLKRGCVMVTCYAPQYLMGALVRMAQENMKVLVESGVTYLSMGYAVLLDNSAQEEISSLEDQISSLEDQIFTSKQEKEHLLVKLKEMEALPSSTPSSVERSHSLPEIESTQQLKKRIKDLKQQLSMAEKGLKWDLEQEIKEQAIQQEEKMAQEKEEIELRIKNLQEKLQSQLEKMEQEKTDFEVQVKTLQVQSSAALPVQSSEDTSVQTDFLAIAPALKDHITMGQFVEIRLEKQELEQNKPLQAEKRDIGVQFNFLVPVSEHLHGVHIAGEKLFSISGRGLQLLEWEEYGFKMQVPEGATAGPCDIAVKAIVAGQFEFPEGTELVSAIYAISASRRLNKPVTLEIQHCVAITSEQQSQFLGFVRAKCNQPTLPYTFTLLKDGVFLPGNEYGKISCDGFSLFGTVKRPISAILQYFFPNPEDPEKKYIAQVCYKQMGGSRNYWNVKFAVTRDLHALEEHVRKQNWETGACLPFTFQSESLELMLKEEDHHKGWSIQPQRHPCEICQKDVDSWSSAEPISCGVTLAAEEGPSTAQFLHYPVEIRGISPKGRKIFIQRCLCSSETAIKAAVAMPSQEPKLPELMNEVAFVIPDQWRAVGDQLNIPTGVLESFSTQHTGNPKACFREVFIHWRDNRTMAYSWGSVLEVLQSAQVGQAELAKQIRNRHQL